MSVTLYQMHPATRRRPGAINNAFRIVKGRRHLTKESRTVLCRIEQHQRVAVECLYLGREWEARRENTTDGAVKRVGCVLKHRWIRSRSVESLDFHLVLLVDLNFFSQQVSCRQEPDDRPREVDREAWRASPRVPAPEPARRGEATRGEEGGGYPRRGPEAAAPPPAEARRGGGRRGGDYANANTGATKNAWQILKGR